MIETPTVGIVGLGYVGLPLAVEFSKRFHTFGYDRSQRRIEELRKGLDRTREVRAEDLRNAKRLQLSEDAAALRDADFVIVAVPTPIDGARRPDLRQLLEASRTAGRNLKKGATVIYESTVYPGVTTEVCVPELEAASGGRWKRDFFVGYSPERINPGDPEHALPWIKKVVSGDTPETLERIAALYGEVVHAGIHKAPNIETAEAAKVIENTQRDLNIALMNELAIIFDRLSIDTRDVLAAARTKWNFLPFTPGLVGGHCIGVDPYYLTYRSEMAGYHPEVILAGRRINDGMAKFVADKTIKMLAATGRPLRGATVNIAGFTFKENLPDVRNSKVATLHAELASFGMDVHVSDPLADAAEVSDEYGITLESWEALPKADALIVAVAHAEFIERPADDFLAKVAADGCVIDVKGILDLPAMRRGGRSCWRL